MNTDFPTSIGAVIVNYNSAEKICDSVKSIYEQSVNVSEIVVVDNGSTDNSLQSIRDGYKEVKIIESTENLGLPAARNKGIECLSTDLILFLDDDAYLEKDCIYHMLELYSQTKAGAVCPAILFYPEKKVIQCLGADQHFIGTQILIDHYKSLHETEPHSGYVGSCIGCCFLINRESVIDCGLFDEKYFMCFEDAEFFYRFSTFGYKIMFQPRAITYHDRGEGTVGLSYRDAGEYPVFRSYLIMRGRLRTIFLHYQLSIILILLPVFVVYEFCTFIYSVKRGWIKQWINAWLWNLRNLNKILNLRGKYKQKRKVRDIDILKPGPLPFTKGLFNNSIERVSVDVLSYILNSYWNLVRCLLKD